jgi:hypothetical protein
MEFRSTGFTIDNIGNIVSLSTVAQGLNYLNNRIGNSVKIQNIIIRFKFQINTAATRTAIRCIVFRDLDGSGTAPISSQLLTTTGDGATVLQPKDYLNADRFSFLDDQLFEVCITNDQMVTYQVNIPHEGHIKYLGTTAAAASNGKGSVYFLVVADEAVSFPSIAYHSRIYFTDD